jgi:hypothetical protein
MYSKTCSYLRDKNGFVLPDWLGPLRVVRFVTWLLGLPAVASEDDDRAVAGGEPGAKQLRYLLHERGSQRERSALGARVIK